MPLLNIMCSGFEEQCAVFDVVDCTDHMATGGKKDASYIAFLFNQWIEKIDPEGKLVDLILFYGALNVQKGGQVTAAKYPRISVLHGAEHVVSLFFSDIAKVWQMKHFVHRYRLIYRIFGSGSMHAPYAMFRDQARMFNGGVKIGLIRAADTRMAGYFIAMHRMLRLKDPLLATINSVQFKGIISKKKTMNAVSETLLDPEFWKSLRIALRALFPPLRVLRLADKCTAGMDKLYYYVRKTDEALQKSADDLDLMTYFTGRETDEEEDDDSHGDGGSDESDDEVDLEDFIDSDKEEGEEEEAEEKEDDDSSTPNNSENLGDIFVSLWKKRRTNLVSDLAIAGKFDDMSHTACQS